METTKLNKEEIIKHFKDAEKRVMDKILKRMIKLSKDKKLKAQMQKEVNDYLSKKTDK